MSRLKLLAALLVAAGTAFTAHSAQKKSPVTAARVCANPLPIPAGFDYPQPASVIQQWVKTGDASRARQHGWYLWAALNAPAGNDLLWRTWCTSTQAFAIPGVRLSSQKAVNSAVTITAKRQADGEFPINFKDPTYLLPPAVQQAYSQCAPSGQLNDGATFQSNGDVMIANVVFSSPAYWWIRDKKLYLSTTLQAQLPLTGRKQIATPMPEGSIVLKAMWWPVQKSGYTALPVWDDAQPGVEDNQYAGFEIQRVWSRAVAVTPNPQPGVTSTDVTYLYQAGKGLGPNTYKAANVVPVQRFYTLQFPDLAALDTCDRALLDASAYWAYNRAFDEDDYLVLIGMHIMTKEQPDWTFQSLWWHDQPTQGPYAADRPDIPASKSPGPWRNYLMTSTYGITQPGGQQWPIAYNPYIELAAAHPIRTNCMNCHRRAAWPPRPPDGPGASEAPASNYEAPGGPDALDVFTIDNPIFNKLLMLDNMWVISDRAVRQPAPSRK